MLHQLSRLSLQIQPNPQFSQSLHTIKCHLQQSHHRSAQSSNPLSRLLQTQRTLDYHRRLRQLLLA